MCMASNARNSAKPGMAALITAAQFNGVVKKT